MPQTSNLGQSADYYKDVFDQMDQGYVLAEVLFNKQGQPDDIFYIEANAAANRMMGIQLAGKRLTEFDPDFEKQWLEIYSRVAETGVTECHEMSASPLRGDFEFNAIKVGNPEERKIAIIYRNVTEKRRVKIALQRSEEQFRLFIIASSSMVYKMSPDWKKMYNLNGKNILSDTDDPTGDWTEKYILEEDRPLVWQTIQQAIDTKSIFELEHRVILADGGTGWVHSRAIPELDAYGRIKEWLGAGSDISERKALQDRQAFLLKFSDTLGLLTDPAEIKTTSALLLSEQISTTPHNQTPAEISLTEDIAERTLNAVDKAKAAGTSREKENNLRDARQEENLREIEAKQQHEIFQVTLTTLEEERHRVAESLHNGVGQILYGAKVNLATLKKDTPEPEFWTTITHVNKLLTEAIKETRRVSHELMPTTLEEFGLSSAIDDICDQLRGDISFSCNVNIKGNRLDKYIELAIYRTVQELMINVVKHAKASNASVAVNIDNKKINIKVHDNGVGLEAAKKDKTGIGLVSIRSKIGLLNGEMHLSSDAGKGTSVEIVIPRPDER